MTHSNPPSAPTSSCPVNVSTVERLLSIAGGAAVIATGIRNRSWASPFLWLAGGLLIQRGASGHCRLYSHFEIDTSQKHAAHGVPDGHGIRLEHAVEVARSPAVVFNYWRNLENLPRFMSHVRSVTQSGSGISHWIVEGPAGQSISWDAEIINEHPAELIAWQTRPGSQVQSAGTVRFHPLEEGRRTRVSVVLQYSPPAGQLGSTVAKWLGASPEKQLADDLSRFKEIIESNAVAADAPKPA